MTRRVPPTAFHRAAAVIATFLILSFAGTTSAWPPGGSGSGGGGAGGGGGDTLEYGIYQLDSAGGAYSGFAADLNDSGTVVGSAVDNATGTSFATCWNVVIASNGTVTSNLSLLPDSGNAHATGINNLGAVVGDKRLASSWLGAYWPSPSHDPLPLPPLSGDSESRTFGINDARIICGVSTGSGERPVVWRITSDANGNTVVAGPVSLPGANGTAWDLSESDADGTVTVAGEVWDDESAAGVTWRIQLESDGGISIDPEPTILQVGVNVHGVNNTGVGCGDSSRPDWIATLWTETDAVPLALDRRFQSSSANDLNDSGVIVGWVGEDASGFPREPAVWAGPDARPVLLSRFLGRKSPFAGLTDAPAINEAGVIAGAGWDHGFQQAFIALPK